MFQRDKKFLFISMLLLFFIFQNKAFSGNFWVNSNPSQTAKFKEHESECNKLSQNQVETLDEIPKTINLGWLALMTTIVGSSLGGQSGMSASNGMLEGYNNSNNNTVSHAGEKNKFFFNCMEGKGWLIKTNQEVENQNKITKEKYFIANEYFISQNWTSLLRFSNDWIAQDSNNPSPYEWRAMAKANLKDKSAIDDFRDNIFLTSNPNVRQYKNLGLAYINFGDYDMAKYQFKKCLKIDPNESFCKETLAAISNNASEPIKNPLNTPSLIEVRPSNTYKWEERKSDVNYKSLQIDFSELNNIKIVSEIKDEVFSLHNESFAKILWETKQEFHPTSDQTYFSYNLEPINSEGIKVGKSKFSLLQIFVWAQRNKSKQSVIFRIEGGESTHTKVNNIVKPPLLAHGKLFF